MSEDEQQVLPATDGELAIGIAALVFGVPGVVRLEPTLGSTSWALVPRRVGVDGVQLARRESVVGVDLSVATCGPASALETASRIRVDVAGFLAANGLVASRIDINVLRIAL